MMKYRFRVAPLLPIAMLLVAALSPAQDSPDTVTRGTKRFRKSVVVTGLEGPWEVTLGADGMLWVTERTGKRVTRINPANGDKKVAVTINEVSAPGGQDGLLGMALDGTHVYVSYTYQDKAKGPDTRVADDSSPYRYLYGKIVRFDYNAANGTMSNPADIITGLPAGNDHNAMRLKIGPDRKLYMTIGDQGNNQLGNFCLPALAQRLPTKGEVDAKNYAAYEGKSLRLNLDGSIPKDNPKFGGVMSHVFTVGHRNTQGIDFGPGGTLYAAEHGPKTDDEINILRKGRNYGWPNVAGLRDNKAYEYARWAEATTPCSQLRFSDLTIHPSVPREPETNFKNRKYTPPIATLFTVPTGFNFEDPKCKGVNFICWPTVGISSVEYTGGGRIPGWDNVLLITTLKRGSIYVLPLARNRKKAAGHMSRYFQSENRFRDTAMSIDGRTIYAATDPSGVAESYEGGVTNDMEDKGSILAFTYEGEGDPNAPPPPRPRRAAQSPAPGASPGMADGLLPQFTAQQVADGKRAYEASCAVCHGNTLTNGTMGTPLGGEYFKSKWWGKTVAAFVEKVKTMPPSAPGSIAGQAYANVIAYILEMNGFKAGATELNITSGSNQQMVIRQQQ